MKKRYKQKSHISSELHKIYVFPNNFRHPVTKTFTTLHPTTLHFLSFKLHPTTLHLLALKLHTITLHYPLVWLNPISLPFETKQLENRR
jgi:hypothetical protein